ncbi:isocitrate lyase/phosphoenolpyruvate mutase family protein, partial [Streptomyces albidoflavus]
SIAPTRTGPSSAPPGRPAPAVTVPVNSTAHPVKHDLDRFRRLGVGRITYGPLLQMAATDAVKDMLRPWAP